jgi:DNA-binding CsgD family transcriptional regulator
MSHPSAQPQPFSYAQIYNSIERVQKYYQSFQPTLEAPETDRRKWLQQDIFFKQWSMQSCVAIGIWDIRTNTFLDMSDERGVLGYDVDLFLADNGVDFTLSNFHPDHLNSVLTLQKKGVEYAIEHLADSKNIIISYDGLYKHQSGNYIKILQQALVLETDASGFPLVYISYVQDISHLKKVDSGNLVIKAPQETLLYNYNFDTSNLELSMKITKQEKRVLRLLSDGKTTQDIAQIISASPHTVDTHRRNLLRKTNCLNTTALVSYARITGLM